MASSSGVVASDTKRLDSKELPSICHLGKGFSGFVYETQWKGNKYARKDFPLGSEKYNYVFETEAKSLFAFDHPNLVKCIGYTVGDSICSLVQEYVDGNLQNTIQRRIEAQRKTNSAGSSGALCLRIVDVDEVKSLLSSIKETRKVTMLDEGGSETGPENKRLPIIPFEVPEAVEIISQIAAGMKHLHDLGVIHGDLKPKNVLMYSENGAAKVKMADFGLNETKKRIKLVSKRTQHLEILRWKAPEFFEKSLGPLTDDPFTDSDTDEDVSFGSHHGLDEFNFLAMADVYSFGLTCSHILGAKLVYPNLSLTQLRVERRAHGFKPELPSAACPDYLRDLIYSCLESKPSSRPTFSDVCARLAQNADTNEITPQLYFNPATKCMEHLDGIICTSEKFNRKQCQYLVDKLKLAIMTALSYLAQSNTGFSASALNEARSRPLEIFKLLFAWAKGIERVSSTVVAMKPIFNQPPCPHMCPRH